MPRFSAFLLVLLVGCASTPKQQIGEEKSPLAGLPASFANTPACETCLTLTLTLRPDGSYLVRERVGGSEFYDFGRWRKVPEGLLLEGGRDLPRRYALQPPDMLDSLASTQGGDLKRLPQVEALRGPFRLVGLYDGIQFKECLTGITWPLDDSRAGGELKQEYLRRAAGKPVLVSVDARFDVESGREEVRIQRSPQILATGTCP